MQKHTEQPESSNEKIHNKENQFKRIQSHNDMEVMTEYHDNLFDAYIKRKYLTDEDTYYSQKNFFPINNPNSVAYKALRNGKSQNDDFGYKPKKKRVKSKKPKLSNRSEKIQNQEALEWGRTNFSKMKEGNT